MNKNSDDTSAALEAQRTRLDQCLQRDQFRFSKEIRKLGTRAKNMRSKSAKKDLNAIARRIDESIERREWRAANLPQPQLDDSLPICERRDDIADAINTHQVVVISGETGSGKSTQLPLIALQCGFGVRGFIGHTQPRRIAARSIASRIASQLNSNIGQAVGFKIRFDDKTSNETFVKLMTDGILLAETQSDRFLDQYEMIIIDEAHERSLNIDFLIGHLKRIVQKRRDLKIVITSATIDTEKFAQHFQVSEAEPVPVINVEGRVFPVETRYLGAEDAPDGGSDSNDHVAACTLEIAAEQRGDILVFLPTENDIRAVSRKLKGGSAGQFDVLPLYARLSNAQQNAIFQKSSRRRVVLATNVAESSITVPGIRIVVDSGTARISRYAPRSKVQRLPIEAISQASADQRAGRCGRVGPGICVRLYSEEDYQSRPKFTTPEIRRTNLASVILQTLALNLGAISQFPFIDPPGAEAISDGYRTLFEIGAIDDRRKLTRLGRWLSNMPIDPRIGRMIHAADTEGCLNEILIIASALEIQDPRIRPAEKQKQADDRHERFRDEKSDFLAYLKIWDFFHKLREDLSRNKFRLACQENFLSVSLLRQWQDIHRQLKNIVGQQKLTINQRQDDYDAIHRSLLAGLLSGIANLSDRYEYTGNGGIKFVLWPGSGVFQSKPKWIIAGEIVETARRYGRTVGRIDPAWIEPLAEHLVKRRYVDPHWSRKRQTVMACENVSLFGLPIVARRRTGFTRIDPELSRQLFIENGLAEFDLTGQYNFLDHNRQLIESVESLAAKTRRRELILDAQMLASFYQENLPQQCCDAASLRSALKADPELDGKLCLQLSDLIPEDSISADPEAYPDVVQIGSMRIPVDYRFEPGDAADGATVRVPKEGLGQINETGAGWLIPGLNQSRIESMIRSLPKSIRRNLVPVPAMAARVAEQIRPDGRPFAVAVADELTAISGETIAPGLFERSRIDDHLFVNLQVVDESGQLIAQGRDVTELRKQFGSGDQTFVEFENSDWHQDGLTDWAWGDLPHEVAVTRGTTQVAVFPAIVDQADSVGLRLVSSAALAGQLTTAGLTRLFAMRLKKHLKRQVNWLPDLDQCALKLVSVISSDALKVGLMDLIARHAMIDNHDLPRTAEQFNNRLSDSSHRVSLATQDVARWLPSFANAVHLAQLACDDLTDRNPAAKSDMSRQIQSLTSDRFLTDVSWNWLQHYPRYFSAITARCEKLMSGFSDRDKENMDVIKKYEQIVEQLHSNQAALGTFDPELERLRWMMEEFRVSLFAQKLGTCLTISEKRIEKQIRQIEIHLK